MEHRVGQIAEYGTEEFENNRAIYTLIEKGIDTRNPNGSQFHHPAEFFHYSEGYKMAGSCATWIKESWGYRVFWPDGTSHGEYFSSKEKAIEKWESVTGKEYQERI